MTRKQELILIIQNRRTQMKATATLLAAETAPNDVVQTNKLKKELQELEDYVREYNDVE